MADREPAKLVEPVTEPTHYIAPGERQLRAQSVTRLQLGLAGLVLMLLLVGLANVIMDRAMLAEEQDPIEEVIAVDTPPQKQASDPLADIGVVPAAGPEPTPAPEATAPPNPAEAELVN